MVIIAKFIIFLFGLFLIGAGIVMFLKPRKAQNILNMAASNNTINYVEISLRMIPAMALIVYADSSKHPEILKLLGWFMLLTSVILFIIPRKWHYNYSQKWAGIIKPLYFQIISPFSMLFGALILYTII